MHPGHDHRLRVGWYVDDVLVYTCETSTIPTVSEWALAVMTLLILTGGALAITGRRAMARSFDPVL